MTSLEDYITWKAEDGLPLDPWLRVHVRLGARLIKVCHNSKIIRGTRSEWEHWTGLRFPQSGKYIIPGALNPVELDIARNQGIYTEANVWIVHAL